jgi:hypothetical protein
VPPDYRAPLPLDAVRDLLAICRALYVAYRDEGPTAAHRLAAIEGIGIDLRSALDLARRCAPDTVGHRAAWGKVDRALAALAEVEDAPLRPGLLAAVERVRRRR